MQGQLVAGKRATGHQDDLFVYWRMRLDEFTIEPVDRRVQAPKITAPPAKRKRYSKA
jgi:hypothetical protein